MLLLILIEKLALGKAVKINMWPLKVYKSYIIWCCLFWVVFFERVIFGTVDVEQIEKELEW